MGITRIRMALPGYTDSSGIAAYKQAVLDAKAAGFYVVWGTNSGGTGILTTHNFATFQNAVVTLATWAQANGLDELMIGNEEMYHAKINPAASGVTASGTTATFVSALVHGLITGDSVTVQNAADSRYNGVFTITVVDTTTFTYTIAAGATSPDTSTFCGALNFTAASMKTAIIGISDAVKAGGFTGKTSYAELQGSASAWFAGGRGSLDYSCINLYGSPFGSESDFRSEATSLFSAQGTGGYFSEMHLNNNWSAIKGWDENTVARNIANRVKWLATVGVPYVYLFTWRWTAGDSFAARLASDDNRPWLPIALGLRALSTGIPNVAVTRSATSSRGAVPVRTATPRRG